VLKFVSSARETSERKTSDAAQRTLKQQMRKIAPPKLAGAALKFRGRSERAGKSRLAR